MWKIWWQNHLILPSSVCHFSFPYWVYLRHPQIIKYVLAYLLLAFRLMQKVNWNTAYLKHVVSPYAKLSSLGFNILMPFAFFYIWHQVCNQKKIELYVLLADIDKINLVYKNSFHLQNKISMVVLRYLTLMRNANEILKYKKACTLKLREATNQSIQKLLMFSYFKTSMFKWIMKN